MRKVNISYFKGKTVSKNKNNVHEGIKEHVCDFCDKSFSKGEQLKSHILKSHGGDNVVFIGKDNFYLFSKYIQMNTAFFPPVYDELIV